MPKSDTRPIKQLANRSHLSTSSIAFAHYSPNATTDGQIWSDLLRQTRTKYVLLGKDMVHFNNQSTVERLISMVFYAGADIVGGSHRFNDGRLGLRQI